MHSFRWRALGCAVVILATCGSARANINFANIAGGWLGDRLSLQQIGVQRGAVARSYAFSDLLQPTLDKLNIPRVGEAPRTLLLYAHPLDGDRDQVLGDEYINTGFLDPGRGTGGFGAGAEFVRLNFETPVRNEAGPDLLVFGISFEFSFGFSTLSSSYISFDGITSHKVTRDADFALGPISNVPMYAYADGVTSPSQLVTETPSPAGALGNPPTAIPRPVIHALDLSEFGLAEGASIDMLYLQDDSADNRNLFPTMVMGLPSAVPEPGVGLLVLLGASLVVFRRGQNVRAPSRPAAIVEC
jgi:hypothetical protein